MLFTFQAVRVLFALLFGRVYDFVFDGEGLPALILAGVLCFTMLLMPLLSPRRTDRARVRGLHPTDARVLDSLASDHRMVVVQAR